MSAITVVIGPPCAGKSTYVDASRGIDDVRVDYDKMAKALGAGVDHRSSGSIRILAFAARTAVIDRIIEGVENDSWIIHTNPNESAIKDYSDAGASFVLVDPGKEVCMDRASQRPAGTVELIESWYESPPVIEYSEVVKCHGRDAHIKRGAVSLR